VKYHNPVIKGFHPDPSICRVGEDYYLVTSSFEYFPGIPIFHSRDLVNWTQIGSCVKQSDQFPLEKVQDSGGIWAPAIRYEKGRFYVTATLEYYGNFIISAEHPAGEWSPPVKVPMGGIDPSILFDGGKAYYCTNETLHPGVEEITAAEIDVNTGVLIGEKRSLWRGIGGGFLEAPHLYHIGDWYYLMTAEGGTNFNHMVTIGRSRSVWGPYEGCPFNPILTNVHDTGKEVQCSGHGDLLQDHRGNWWMIHLAIRLARRTMSHLGRETFLTPVTWQDGWPMVAGNHKAVLNGEGPLWEEPKEPKEWKADFTGTDWEPEWIFLRNPLKDSYRRGQGKLRLYPSAVTLRDAGTPTFAAIRQRDFDCELFVEYIFAPVRDGDEAGIAIVLSSEFHYFIGKKRNLGQNTLVIEKRAEDFYQTPYQEPIPDGKLRIKVKADKEYYTFYFAAGEEPLREICRASTRFLACEMAGKCFTGTVMGVYTASLGETEAVMEVTRFEML